MKTLVLNLKGEFFNEIKAGVKPFEFREQNEYWRKRLEGVHYDNVTFCLGYPAREDMERRLTYPYSGYESQIITHRHFGNVPKSVFAIRTYPIGLTS